MPLLSFCELRLPGIHTKLPRAFCGSRNGSLFPNKKTIHSQWKASYRQPTVLKRTRGSQRQAPRGTLGNDSDVIMDSSHRISFNHAYVLSSRIVVSLILRVLCQNSNTTTLSTHIKLQKDPKGGVLPWRYESCTEPLFLKLVLRR